MTRVLNAVMPVILSALITVVPSVSANWVHNGVPICAATSDQFRPLIISDDAGGAIITWDDVLNGTTHAQRINASGALQWGEDGVLLFTATEPFHGNYCMIVSDGSGGAIVTWQDNRSGNYDIYAQRVNASGAVQWATNGVPLCSAALDQEQPTITSDGSGGAIVTWMDSRRADNADLYAQRVNASGAVQWATDGVPLCTAAGGRISPMIISDDAGGAVVIWLDGRSGTHDIYAQRVNASGAVQWATNGVPLCSPANAFYPAVTSDGAGGAIVSWETVRTANAHIRGDVDIDIYAQCVSGSGVVQWAAEGVAICAAKGHQHSPRIASDGVGGAIVVWWGDRNEKFNIYAQRVDASGAIKWKAKGIPLCPATHLQESNEITSDGAGGAIVTWYDSRSGNSDIYAQRVNGSGAVPWATDGVALCTAPGNQLLPQIASDGAGGAIVTWTDESGATRHIYALRVHANGCCIVNGN